MVVCFFTVFGFSDFSCLKPDVGLQIRRIIRNAAQCFERQYERSSFPLWVYFLTFMVRAVFGFFVEVSV